MNAFKALEKVTTKNDGTDHEASMLICNSYKPFGVHAINKLSQLSYNFWIMSENTWWMVSKKTQKYRNTHISLWIDSTSDDYKSSCNQKDGRVAFGHYWHAIIFYIYRRKRLKFNDEFFTTQDRIIKIDKMMEGEVSEIRNTLLQIITFLAKDISSKTPVPDRKVHYSFDH